MNNDLEKAPLGQNSSYKFKYDPTILFPIPRSLNRNKLKLNNSLPFSGVDLWNSYELSWLNPKGKPMVALALFTIDCHSANIIESKSFKLYLNSFNNTYFNDPLEVHKILTKDLSNSAEGNIAVELIDLKNTDYFSNETFSGSNLDDLDIETDLYSPAPLLLKSGDEIVTEELYSNLLKSNCLKTHQPDWGTVYIKYKGRKIDHEGLLKYIISYRNHNDFHEHCVEQIYCDILNRCQPDKLTVYARYTRRGGLDINPFRTNCGETPKNIKLIRQ